MGALPRDTENGHDAADTMRSWLASGAQVVDPRRRFGRHDRTRKLLITDPGSRPSTTDGWQSTTAALQRHTVSGALTELEPEHRRVIKLAYLEGHTNRQIAAALGVSVTTAKRRLIKALERLEVYMSAAGAWLAAVLIFVGARVARVNPSSDAQRVASTVTAGVLAAAAVGVITFLPDTSPRAPRAAVPAVIAPAVAAPLALAHISIGGTQIGADGSVTVDVGAAKNSGRQPSHDTQSGSGGAANQGANGCHGNPTGAPPGTPVSHNGHLGPPVNPPGQGGCPAL